MKEIKKYTAEIDTVGNGYLRLELDDGEVIDSVQFPSSANFAAVCTMLNHGTVFYEYSHNNHNFISTKV